MRGGNLAVNGGDQAPMLELRQVNKRFGGLHAVNDISFQVAPGSIKAVIGPNGA